MAKIKRTRNTKCWQGSRTTRTFTPCLWEGKVVQPPWKIFFAVPCKVKHMLNHNIQWNCFHPTETKDCVHIKPEYVYSDFIHNQPKLKHPNILHRWPNKLTMTHLYNGVLLNDKKAGNIDNAVTWMNLKCTMLSERNHIQSLYPVCFYLYNIRKRQLEKDIK